MQDNQESKCTLFSNGYHLHIFFECQKLVSLIINAEINIGFRQDTVESSETLILDLWFPVAQSTINKRSHSIFLFE